MKSFLRRAVLGAALLFVLPAFAADPLAISQGTIKKVDKAAGRLTISHGPLENLGMPGMTMAFKVKDPAWLDRFKAGDKVRFRVEEVKADYVVVRIEAAP
jgi:Cu/Ag efflux protein CusF